MVALGIALIQPEPHMDEADFVGDATEIGQPLAGKTDIFRKAKLADGAIDNNYPLIADNTSYSNYLHLMTSEQIGMNTLLGYSQVWTRLSDTGGTLASDIMLGYRYYVASKAGSMGKRHGGGFSLAACGDRKVYCCGKMRPSGTGHFLSQRRTMKRMQPRKRTRRMCLRTRTGCRSCSFTQLPSTGKRDLCG